MILNQKNCFITDRLVKILGGSPLIFPNHFQKTNLEKETSITKAIAEIIAELISYHQNQSIHFAMQTKEKFSKIQV